MVEIAHERRARIAAGHAPGRATHVDVDDVGAARRGDPRALPHPVRLASGELDRVERKPDACGPELCFAFARRQRVTGGHLRDHQSGAKLHRQPPERRVRDTRHGRKQDPVG